MKKFLLSQDGNFYKANLHCHTVLSDACFTPEQVKELYLSLGYSIVAYTDHDVFIPHPELNDESFLALHGVEIEINQFSSGDFNDMKSNHFCAIALDPDNHVQPCWNERFLYGNAPKNAYMVKKNEDEPPYEREYTGERISDNMQKFREAGFFVTYNHPTWSMESCSEYMNFHGMNAFEMFNGSAMAMGFEDYNPRVYDDILRGGERIYCIGADDNHNHGDPKSRRHDSGWAWTVIKADKLEYKTVTQALTDGNFYASEGPEIYELWYEDGRVHIKCSDADRINYNTGRRCARMALCEEGETLTEASFEVSPKDVYFRLTVTDKKGRHACTNAYFIDELN